jgi:hypothetical protein
MPRLGYVLKILIGVALALQVIFQALLILYFAKVPGCFCLVSSERVNEQG